jgi:cullin-4
LRRTLQSLACGKKKVLKKHPVGREVEDDDVFRFNADFWDERARVHIHPGEDYSTHLALSFSYLH